MRIREDSMSKSLMVIVNDVADRVRDGCWIWPFKKDKDGYGRIFAGGMVSHIVLELTNRPKPLIIEDGQLVNQHARHACDVKGCYNPDHLLWGSAQDNADDRVDRGRVPKGEDHVHSKLTVNQVLEIRNRYEKGHHNPNNIVGLGAEFNVTPRTIANVVTKKTWRHV